MDARWRRTVDRTLRSTEETIQRLQERHANHEMVKRLVDEALYAPSTYPASSGIVNTLPPPLPNANHVFGKSSGPVGNTYSAPAVLEAVATVEAQVRSVTVAMELERTVRLDSVREMKQQTSHQIAELKGVLQQLSDENKYLKESIRVLEVQVLHSGAGVSTPSQWNSNMTAHGVGSRTESNCHSLQQRIETLEATAARQQRHQEGQQGRQDSLLREIVNTKIESEVERMRSIAREATRECVEDVLKLRLNALQSMFNDELRRAMESTGAVEAVVRTTERHIQQLEKDHSHRMMDFASQLDDLKGNLKGVVKDEVQRLERQVTELAHNSSHEVEQLRQGIQEQSLRSSRSITSAVDAMRIELQTWLTRKMQEWSLDDVVTASGVSRLLEDALGPLQREASSLGAAAEKAKENFDKWVREAEQRLLALETAQQSLGTATADDRHRLERFGQQQEQTASELSVWKGKLRDALAVVEGSRVVAKEALDVSHGIVDKHHELSCKVDAQVGRLELVGSQLGDVELLVQDTQRAIPKAVQPVSVKLDALYHTVQDVCVPQLTMDTQSLQEVQARVQFVQDSIRSHKTLVVQQLSDAKHDIEAQVHRVDDQLKRTIQDLRHDCETTKEELVQRAAQLDRAMGTLSKVSVSKEDLRASLDEVLKRASSAAALMEQVEFKVPKAPGLLQAVGTHELPMVCNLTKRVDELVTLDSDRQVLVAEMVRRLNDVESKNKEMIDTLEKYRVQQEHALQETITQETHRTKAALVTMTQRFETSIQEHSTQLTTRVTEVEHSAQTNTQRWYDRMKEQIAPRRLVGSIASDDGCLKDLASSLQGYMSMSNDTTEAISQLRRQVHQTEGRISVLNDLQEKMDDCAQKQDIAERQNRLLEDQMKRLASSHEGMRSEYRDAVAQTQEQLKQVDGKICAVRRDINEHILSTSSALSQMERNLSGSVEAVKGETAALNPKVEQLAARQDSLQPLLDELMHTTGQQQGVLERTELTVRRLEERQEMLQERHQAGLLSIEEATMAQVELMRQSKVDPCIARVDALESRQQALEQDGRLQGVVASRVEAIEAGIQQLQQQQQPSPSTLFTGGQMDGRTAAHAPISQDQEQTGINPLSPSAHGHVRSIEGRLELLEARADAMDQNENASLHVAADTLTPFCRGLEHCVRRVAEELQADGWSHELLQQSIGGAERETIAAAESASSAAEGAALRLETLDDIFVCIVRKLRRLDDTQNILRQSEEGVLDLIQQHVIEADCLPFLQKAVLQLADQLATVATTVGADSIVSSIDVGPIIPE